MRVAPGRTSLLLCRSDAWHVLGVFLQRVTLAATGRENISSVWVLSALSLARWPGLPPDSVVMSLEPCRSRTTVLKYSHRIKGKAPRHDGRPAAWRYCPRPSGDNSGGVRSCLRDHGEQRADVASSS